MTDSLTTVTPDGFTFGDRITIRHPPPPHAVIVRGLNNALDCPWPEFPAAWGEALRLTRPELFRDRFYVIGVRGTTLTFGDHPPGLWRRWAGAISRCARGLLGYIFRSSP